MITITEHAAERAKERCKWNRKTTERMAMRALSFGLHGDELSGALKRYISKRNAENAEAKAYVHGDFVYIFCGIILITVIEIPKQFRGAPKESRKDVCLNE